MSEKQKNRFLLGNVGKGRPPIYKTVEEFASKAAEYFELETQKNGVCKPTITGLCFHLGYADRVSFHDQAKRGEDFSYTVKYIQTFIQSCYEKNLHGFNYAGSIFALKNLDPENWKDKSEQNVNQTVTQVTPQVIQSNTPPLDNKE